MDDDDFGDLYDPDLPIVAPKTPFDDEDDDDYEYAPNSSHPVYLSKPLDSFSVDRAPNMVEQDLDDDEDDMLLLGYNGNSGLALCSVEAPLGEHNCKVSTVVATKHHDIPATEIDNLGEAYPELMESERVEGASANGVIPADKVGYASAAVPKEGYQSVIVNSLDDPERSPDIGDLTNRTVSIPGLSTTVSVAPFEIEDNIHAMEDNWEEEGARKELLQADTDPAAGQDEDWDSDSQDDLQIVLNNDRSMYASGDKAKVSRFEGDSEDEDEEDLIIVAGGEFADDQEWVEEQPLLSEAQAVPADGSIVLEGDKQGDEKGVQEKTGQGVATSQSVLRSGHGFHNHPSAFKYVRPGAAPFYGGLRAPVGQNNRVKGASGSGDWRGSGRGSYGSQTVPQLPSWGTSVPHGTKPGYEFTLPPSKTVFDLDLEFFDEKPWRHPAVDASDYFNFGFNENTWKDYCKQLAQLRLESTMQSKIRVYESGRSEQEYDPDLPRELVAAAGLHEGGERNRHHQIESEAGAAAMGRGRFNTHMIPTGRPIQVESGLGDRRPSADLRKQRLRDSDAIILVEPMADEEKQGKRDEDAINKEEVDDDGDEEEEEEEVRTIFKPRPQQLLWHEDRGPSERKNIHQGASFLPPENFKKGGARRLSCGSDSDEITTFSTGHVMQAGRQVGKTSVSTGFGMFSGQAVNHSHRDTISSPPTPPGMVVDERIDLDFNRSHSSGLCQDAKCNPKDLKDDESFVPRQTVTGEKLQSDEGSHADDLITAENCQNMKSELSGEPIDSRRYISREVAIHDMVPEELQPNSPGFSPMRQRLASPEGSQTASRDDFDVQKATKSIVLMKESGDSGESARHGWEDAMNASHARENKRHCGLSKENKCKDSREGSEIRHKKQDGTYIRHDAESETDSRGNKLHDPRKIAVEASVEKARLKEPSRQWPEREKTMYIQKKEREEELRKRVHLGKDGTHYTERVGNRSDLRSRDDELRRDRRDMRKRDDEDRRDRVDKGFHQREREVESSNRHNAEKESIRRKREEEYRRKDRSEKEEDGRSQKEKEKHGLERHDRHVDVHLRRKEEESWKRDRLEEHHRLKARDGSWRDRKETQYRNGVYRDVHVGTRKDDDRIGQIGRSRRHDEDRSWHGRDESRKSEVVRAAEPRDYSREKRKRSEEFGKDKSRSFEGRAKPGSDREDLHLSEKVILEDDKLLSERAIGKHSKCSDEQRTSGWRLQSDKHKSELKRNRDLDSHINESAARLGEFSDSSRRKRTANGKNETVSRKRLDNPDIAVGDETLSARTEYRSSHPEKHFANEVSFVAAKTGLSENEEHTSKGRSKLERWTSHKDLEFGTSEKASSQDKHKMKDQRLMPGEKHKQNNLDFHSVRENSEFALGDQQIRETHMKTGEVSLSPEQANGYLTQAGEKRESVGQNDREVSSVDNKSSREHPEQRYPTVPRMDIATKLERRKERFKASMEDRDLAKMLEDYQQIDKDEAMQERPARKRRWTSG